MKHQENNDNIPGLGMPLPKASSAVDFIHPLFAPVPRVEVSVTTTRPKNVLYDWVPGKRGLSLQPEGQKTGEVQLADPMSLLSLHESGKLIGQAARDAENVQAVLREYLRAIYVNEQASKRRLMDVLSEVKEKKKTLDEARAELAMLPPTVDLSEEALEGIQLATDGGDDFGEEPEDETLEEPGEGPAFEDEVFSPPDLEVESDSSPEGEEVPPAGPADEGLAQNFELDFGGIPAIAPTKKRKRKP